MPATAVTEIPVVFGEPLRSGTKMIVGLIDAETLVNCFEVPYYNYNTKAGYQRPAQPPRVNALVHQMKSRDVDLPTAVLLNLRDFEEGVHLVETDGRHVFLPNSARLQVVDGQHRILALEKLMEDRPDEWASFQIPFVCMLGADEREEMQQFYVVNSTAKSVKTDLALTLLKDMAERSPRLMQSLQERNQRWMVVAQTLVEHMSKNKDSVWKNRIRFPSMPKGDTVIANAGFANSLKPLINNAFFSQLTTPNQVQILSAFWTALSKLIPDAFMHPTDYVIQKSTGVTMFHMLLPFVIEVVRSQGRSVVDPETYLSVMHDPLLQLNGENGDGKTVTGEDFWRTAPEGAAGSFSSNAGRRVLVARMRDLLPEIEL